MRRADIGVGVGLMVFSAWVFWYAGTYRKATIYYYGPHFFPQVLAIAMAACACILIIRAVQGNVLSQTDRIDLRGFLRMGIAIAMCIGYLFLMQVIGFAVGTSVFLFALMTFLGHRGIFKRALNSVAVSLIVWSIFRFFLIIPLPTGVFHFTF